MLHTILKRERDQQSAYFPTDDIFLNFGSNSRLAVYSKPDSVCTLFENSQKRLPLPFLPYSHVQVCRESCCHAQMSLYLYKHECRRKPLICFEQVSLNGIIINSCSSSSSFTSASSSSSMTIVSSSSLSSICKQ